MKKKIGIIFFSMILLLTSGCNLLTKQKDTVETEVNFAEGSENVEEMKSIEINYDSEKLEGWGYGFEGIINTKSYKLLPLDHYFTFELIRSTNIMSANFKFKSDRNETLSFIVDLEKKVVVEKKINTEQSRINKISDEEVIDIANSIKRMYEPLTDWK